MLHFRSPINVLPLSYQSYNIPLTEWISILTLCLAPLVAHIFAGVPRSSYLCNNRPKWHEVICHYNPTSILWRYAAITDRRFRAKSWDTKDLAASNTLFWTSRGWDGSEAMVHSSIPYCTRLPEHKKVTVLSQEMVKTVIVLLQGIQAIVLLIQAIANRSDPSNIFLPLAIIGLMRLYCGLWLTEDYAYTSRQFIDQDCTYIEMSPNVTRSSLDNLMLEYSYAPPEDRFRPTSSWGSKTFRAFFLLQIVVMFTLCVPYLYLLALGDVFTLTTILVLFSYITYVGATAMICSYYFIRGYTGTTIIPCIGATWYKVYTGIVIGLAIMLLVVSCIETRKTICGTYTSAPSDYAAC
ncbi:hypothetical protein F5Y04DRAFT_287292 [Hypomontagnella monticulosa]|nr:hypothetical protein F5Y04DRAFT_287292 [Hypomontagnella monticulosa]